jgi:hypothetical protein
MADRNREVPDDDPLQCSQGGCRTIRRVTVPVALCAKHRQKLVRGTLVLEASTSLDTSLLEEDGIIDPVAVEIAAKGFRRVNLTQRERLLATALIMEVPRTPSDTPPVGEVIHERLGVPRDVAWLLIKQVRESGIDVSGVQLYAEDVNNQDPTGEMT